MEQALTGAIVGAASASTGVQYTAPRESHVSATLISGSLSDDYLDISVGVTANGPAFGGSQYATLYIRGTELYSYDARMNWSNFNSEGWPEAFVVSTSYSVLTPGKLGEVYVQVRCDDVGHPNYGDIAYQTRLAVHWE